MKLAMSVGFGGSKVDLPIQRSYAPKRWVSIRYGPRKPMAPMR